MSLIPAGFGPRYNMAGLRRVRCVRVVTDSKKVEKMKEAENKPSRRDFLRETGTVAAASALRTDGAIRPLLLTLAALAPTALAARLGAIVPHRPVRNAMQR